DTYAFIEDRNEEYIASNLIDGTFADLELNLMLFIDSSGQIVFGKAFDLENEEELPIPPSLVEHLAPNAPLVRHTSTEGSISGIVLLAENPMLVVSRPIITSLDEGPIRGALIMGRYLDAAEVADIAEITQLSFSVHRFADSQLSSNLQEAKSSLSEDTPVFIQPLSEESIAGYTLLEDIYGNPGLILEVDIPRAIARQGQATLQYLILSILAVGLAFSVVVLLSLNRLVLSPLSQLNDSVDGIGASGDLSQRVTIAGRDEIANLAGAINKTLASLERSQNELQVSEEKYRMLVENANEAIVVAQDGMLKFVNPKAVEISGYSQEELTSRPFVDFVHPDDREMVLESYLKRLKGEEQPSVYSLRLASKGGNIFWVEINAVLITWEGRPATLNFLNNITERKRAENLINLQHDLAMACTAVTMLDEGLRLCLESVIHASGMDCGGIYLVDETTGALDLVVHTGLSPDFIVSSSHYEADSPSTRLIMAGKPIYAKHSDLGVPLDEARRREGLRASAIIPVHHEDQVIGCLNTASHMLDEVPVFSRGTLETIAAQIGSSIVRLKAEKALWESEERYRLLTEESPLGLAIISSEGDYKYVNSKFVELFGYTLDDIHTGRDWFSKAFPDEQYQKEAISTWIEDLRASQPGEFRPRTFTVRCKDGSKKVIYFRSATMTTGEQLITYEDVTEQMRAQEEISRLYELKRAILEKAPFGIFVIDSDGTVEYVNPVMRDISGDTKEQLENLNVFELPPYQKLGLTDKIKSALQGEPFFMESVEYTSHYAKKSSIRNFTGMPFVDEEGGRKALVFVEDITGVKEAEKALRESEERYRSMIASTGTGMCIIEDDMIISFANDELARIAGYTKEEVEGKVHWTDFVAKDDLEVMKERHKLRRVDDSQPPSTYEFRLITKGGDVRDILLNITIIPGTKKSLASLIDITERKRMERELRESEEKYRSLVESTEDSVYLVDKNCRYLFINRRHLSRLGLTSKDILGRTYSEVHSEVTTKKFADEVGEVFETGDSVHSEHESTRNGRNFLRTLSPVNDSDGRTIAVTVVSKDITELKRVENERKRFITELEAKNAELERFTYTVSHDLASPLFAIRGFTTIAREDLEQGNTEHLTSDLERIEGAAAKMDLLLKDTLELSRIGRVANPPEDVPFGEIVKEALEQTVAHIESSGVEVSVAEDFPTVHVDRMRIVEVLVNLIGNSIKCRGDQPTLRIDIGYRLDGQETVFFVKDNGIGIDPSQHEKVFDLFYKVNATSTGTGAGLAIVKRIIEVHGGRIWIESEKGKGCTVCFTLPVS
ncbi:MAG: PAS domain S-box protein, partial [Methanomicrobia archaeon]|nr:PAS domain S-box protein [Methanomicrobia archaeon]